MDENTTLINITIDEDLRTLTIPTNGTVFGVVGDISVNRVMFVLPRYFRGFDLTQCVARVNYCNSNGDTNYYEADDLAETEGKATFTWLMAPDVTLISVMLSLVSSCIRRMRLVKLSRISILNIPRVRFWRVIMSNSQ